ncbi:MAG: hypothetical protein ABFS30_15210, partial [Pseudomonadota bacterium]
MYKIPDSFSSLESGSAARGRGPLMRGFDDADAMVAALEPSYPVYCLRPHVLAENARRFIEGFP